MIATELAIELTKRNHELHLICHHRPVRLGRSYPGLVFHGVEVTPYPPFAYPCYTLSLASKIYDVAVDYNLDILHVHYAIPHTPSALLARLMMKESSPKIITTLHGTDIHLVGFDPSLRKLTKFSIEVSDGVTAVSHYLSRLTMEEFGLEKDKGRVIYNFVDPQRFTQQNQQDLARIYSPNGERIITHISNFREIKRVPDLISAYKIISLELPSRLLLIGDGPEMNRVENMVKELGLSQKVILLGEINDIAPYLATSDLFILASQMESFGLAALEAMSCGVPVVATRVGGLPEVVEDGVSGYLVDLGDVEGLARRSLEILQDKRLQNEMGQAGRRIACERFSIKEMVTLYEEYYKEILNP